MRAMAVAIASVILYPDIEAMRFGVREEVPVERWNEERAGRRDEGSRGGGPVRGSCQDRW